MTIDHREDFREAMLFGNPDRVPLAPGDPRESTLEAWYQQGLMKGVPWQDQLCDALGLRRGSLLERRDVGSSLFKMIPLFEEKVIEHRDGHYLVQDWMGAVVEISDRYDYTYIRRPKDFVTRKWHRFPVESRQNWEERMKWRYDAQHPDRFTDEFRAQCRALRNGDEVLEVVLNGPFWQMREWCGFENLCFLMAEQPDFIQEMVDFWTDFALETYRILSEEVTPDMVWISEDMAYKAHSMISPAMTRRYLLPTWTKWTEAVVASGCPLVCMDCDGYVAELMPIWLEADINCSFPSEVAAGNDIVTYRREYGSKMAYIGGLDKRELATGGDRLRQEVLRVVPPLFEDGGFLPGCDHGVPPDISWPNFIEYSRLLAELSGWL